jgi:DNA-binding winged helix-turn-helix (wHTH) protein
MGLSWGRLRDCEPWTTTDLPSLGRAFEFDAPACSAVLWSLLSTQQLRKPTAVTKVGLAFLRNAGEGMLSPSSQTEKRIAVIGPLRIDLGQRKIFGPNGPSGLNKRSETLLIYLCEQANSVVTRESILENVWEGRPVEEAAITNCVWYIRKAIGDEDKSILQTRAKKGYSLSIADSSWLYAKDEQEVQEPHQDKQHKAEDYPQLAAVYKHLQRKIMMYCLAATSLALITGSIVAWKARNDFEIKALEHSLSASIKTSQKTEWLKRIILLEMAESASLRDVELVAFDRTPTKFIYSGTHIDIDITETRNDTLRVKLSTIQKNGMRTQTFESTELAVGPKLRKLLHETIGINYSAINSSERAYISGLAHESGGDHIAAIAEYRLASMRAPNDFKAKFALLRQLQVQGKSKESVTLLEAIDQQSLTPKQRCQSQTVMAQLNLKSHHPIGCDIARMTMLLQKSDWKNLLLAVERAEEKQHSPNDWRTIASLGIQAAIGVGDYAQAETRIMQAERIAMSAGWERTAVSFDAYRALIEIYRGRLLEASKIHQRVSDRFRKLDLTETADYHAIYAFRTSPTTLGEAVTVRRNLLNAIEARARDSGNVANELEAIQILARIDRGNPALWEKHIQRLRFLGEGNLSTENRIQNELYALDEVRMMRRYSEALYGLSRLPAAESAEAKIWAHMIRIESHFARDEIDKATAAVENMQSDGVDIISTGSACHIAWLFAEAGKDSRANEFLRHCKEQSFDRLGQATRGDFSFLAQARLLQNNDMTREAWNILSGRIAQILAHQDASPQEIDSMLLLARHSTDLPEATGELLQQALDRGYHASRLDGAGPSLRFGVHLLRWRLCTKSLKKDCGPALPEWAKDDLFEARVAALANRRKQSFAGH